MKIKFLQAGSVFIATALFIVGCAIAAPIPTGLGQIEVGSGTNAITVFTFKPEAYRDGPLVVVFHGVLRNAEDYCRDCIPMASVTTCSSLPRYSARIGMTTKNTNAGA